MTDVADRMWAVYESVLRLHHSVASSASDGRLLAYRSVEQWIAEKRWDCGHLLVDTPAGWEILDLAKWRFNLAIAHFKAQPADAVVFAAAVTIPLPPAPPAPLPEGPLHKWKPP